MNIFLAQQNYHIGNFAYNTDKIIQAIHEAIRRGGDLIIFPELSICGYPPLDLLEYDSFLQDCENAIQRILKETKDIGVIVGAPSRNPDSKGKDLYNSAYFLYEEKIVNIIHKTLLPTYDVFDEYRYFEPARSWEIVHFKENKLAITICEDIWHTHVPNPLYRHNPLDELIACQPDLIINISASPFDYLQQEERLNTIRDTVAKYKTPLIYCNTVGAQTDLIFDGGSLVMNTQKEIVCRLADFREDFATVHWDHIQKTFSAFNPTANKSLPVTSNYTGSWNPDYEIPKIHEALILGIRDYFHKMNFQKAIVASSGGIDSALVIALACEALGPQQVETVLMPSEFSSAHSVADAIQLSENTGNPYYTLPISSIFNSYIQTLADRFQGLPFGVAEENLQSRIRGALVMAISNKFGSILLNTSNKSELATGYGTLYGDMAGGLSVLGDLYKTQVYALAKYLNRNGVIIPENILTKEPSAELRPGQKDSDSLPPYHLLDAILYLHVEHKLQADAIIAKGYEAEVVHRVLRLVFQNEYKRYQFCPILRISPKAFGSGRRIPLVANYKPL